MNTNRIEQLLRKAPHPTPPAGLLQDLNAAIEVPRLTSREVREGSGWLRRWIPALGFAVWFLGCLVVLGMQTSQITQLKHRAHESEIAARAAEAQARAAAIASATDAAMERARQDRADVERLRSEVERLRNELAELPKLQAQNEALRARLKSQVPVAIKPEQDFFATAQNKAMRTQCVNSLKQFVLASLMWADDANKKNSMPTQSEVLKPYLGGSEKLLFCPEDGKTRFEILSPGISLNRSQAVFVRCPIHNNVGLLDGSVHQLGGSARVTQVNGEWVIER